jgi:xanthosine utilization system XapX-like protein
MIIKIVDVLLGYVLYSARQRIYEMNRLSVSADDSHISGKTGGIYAQNNPPNQQNGLEGQRNYELTSGGCGILG